MHMGSIAGAMKPRRGLVGKEGQCRKVGGCLLETIVGVVEALRFLVIYEELANDTEYKSVHSG